MVSPPGQRLSSHISHHESATLLAQRAERAPRSDSQILNAPISTRCVIAVDEDAMQLKINLDQEDLMLGTAALICALVSIAVIFIDH